MVMLFQVQKNGSTFSNFGPMVRVATNGTYSIDHLRAGDYTVVALLPGYLSPLDDLPIDQGPSDDSQSRDVIAQNGTVSVRDNETASMDITLTRGATLSGHVVYSDGAPATQTLISIEDVNAKLAHNVPQNPGGPATPATPLMNTGGVLRGFLLHQNQGTNDRGDFRISGLRPGTYRVAAVLPSPDQNSDSGGASILFGVAGDDPKALRVYGGDTLHRNTAKTYELRAGDETSGVEITIPLDAFHRVEGHLTTIDGRPIIVAAISLTDTSDNSFELHSRPARDGEFVFPEVPTGTYKLAIFGARLGSLPDNMPPASAVLQNPESFADKTTTVLVKDSDITDLSIQLESAAPAANQPTTTPAASQ